MPPSQRIAFIPNMFVQMHGQHSPLRRLVQYGELGPLMLAAELYHKQDLMNERGVPMSAIRAYYGHSSSVMAGRSPSGYRLHYLAPGRRYSENGKEGSFARVWEPGQFRHPKDTFWNDLQALDRTNLVEWAIYSANGKPKNTYDFNRPQRPLGVLRNSKQVPNAPEAEAACMSYYLWEEDQRIKSGSGVLDPVQLISFWRESSPIVVVEDAQVSHVEGVGILRMVYRADTENTAQWFRDVHKERRDALFFLERARKAAFPETSIIQLDTKAKGASGSAISK